MLVIEILFWGSVVLILYTYFGYPLILKIWSYLSILPICKKDVTPPVSLVLCAYNESSAIGEKLENCLNLNYPEEKLEIIVVSDGSTDGTDEVVRGFSEKGVKLIRFPERRGKADAINEAIQNITSEIVFFSDVRQTLHPDSVRELVSNFADPAVGAVSGELHLRKEKKSGIPEGVSFYWRYEKSIRKLESQLDSVIGVTGAICAIRRTLYRELPSGAVLDDVMIPMDIAMRGYRVVFEPNARAFDPAVTTIRQEWGRKVRTLAGNYQILGQRPELLSPRKNRLFFQYLSHKVLRLFIPFAMAGAFTANLFLTGSFYVLTLEAQVVFYLLGITGLIFQTRGWHFRIFSLPGTLILLNASSIAGLMHYLTRKPLRLWEKTKP